MAYINGNKPIVTNGLVYALDFGNTKSYVSGSNRAVSLAFDPAGTTVVTGSATIPVLANVVLNFTGSQFVRRTGSIDTFASGSSFTVQVVGKANSSGNLFSINTPVGNLSTSITPSSSLFGFNLPSGDFSRGYIGFTSSSLQHITYRYSQGTIDIFLNGIPVTASAANSAITTTTISNALFINSGSNFFSGSVAQFYVYNRALSSDEIYENYLVSAGRNNLPVIPKPYTQDENVFKFLQTTGITDLDTVSAIDTFVSNLKSNGLWNKMTAIYPFLTTLTGSQTVNLKDPGVLGLGLTGSFTGSNVGLTPGNSTAYVDALPSNIPYPLINSASAHLSLLSYDIPQGNGFLAGNSARAVGGDLIVSSGSRIYHVYRNVGTSSFVMGDPTITNVEVLVVAGGGSGDGGGFEAGGGGAGGLIQSASFAITPGNSINTIVGNGGFASNGQNSVFSTIIAIGGGRSDSNGGSGGGGGSTFNTTSSFGTGSTGQGNNGGFGLTVYDHGSGGGGGAGAPGQNAGTTASRAGSGGNGLFYPQYVGIGLGFPAGWFAGGGGGSNDYANADAVWSTGSGGLGGGGNGSRNARGVPAQPGRLNTGGGGGGRGYNDPAGGSLSYGGSGIIIVSYNLPASALTGSGTGFFLTDSALTASVNSQFTSGITGSGNIGFLTVSRTGSNSFSIRKNNSTVTINSASLGALSTDIFFNTANLAGSGSLPQPTSISYASIGAGLTDSEVSTYYNLVSQFQSNLKRQNTLLDNFTGAAAAYSLRRIGPSGYFGPAIRVRRDSDNTLRDIGFTSDGQLDTVGLLDFVGVTGSGFVNTWYDQSGNSNNASQATSASQPRVILSGSITLVNNKPALGYALGGSMSLSFNSITNIRSIITYMNKFAVNAASKNIFLLGDPSTVNFHGGDNNNSYFQPAFSALSVRNGAFYRNGTQISTTATAVTDTHDILTLVLSGSSQASTIVQDRGNVRSLERPLPELIIFNTDQTTNRSAIESNINNNYKIFGSATASFDPDYQSFITATGITQPTQSAALETLVSDLKSYGLWSKMKAIYPMVTDRNNRLSDSQNLTNNWSQVSSSLTISSSGAPDGSNTGFLFKETAAPIPFQTFTVTTNGSSNYIIDGVSNPTLNLERGKTYNFNKTDGGHPFYIQTVSGVYDPSYVYNTGVTNNGVVTGILTIQVTQDTPQLYYACGSYHAGMVGSLNIINNQDQHFITRTVVDDVVSGSENVVSIFGKYLNRPWINIKTDAGAQGWFNIQTGITGSFTGSNITITPAPNGWYRCALFFTASAATAPRVTEYHLADSDNNLSYAGNTASGSYIWGAQWDSGNLLGPYRVTSNGFGTGSVLDQMKFNLKTPVDTDAGFRLVYSGNWNPGYGSNKPDGQTAWADTKLTPNTNLTLNNTHFSLYLQTPPKNLDYQGSEAGGRFMINYYPNQVISDHYGSSGGRLEVSVSITKGLITTSRINSTSHRLFLNRNLIGSKTALSDSGLPSGRMYLGGGNVNGGPPVYYSTAPLSFSTIGDGLTDYEAKALYWIVQKFQTTLGRQVY